MIEVKSVIFMDVREVREWDHNILNLIVSEENTDLNMLTFMGEILRVNIKKGVLGFITSELLEGKIEEKY